MENHVTNLDLSIKLKEAGFKQESDWYWVQPIQDGPWILRNIKFPGEVFTHFVSAYLSDELGEMLLERMKFEKIDNGMWGFHLKDDLTTKTGQKEFYYLGTEVEARGRMLLYLKERGLI